MTSEGKLPDSHQELHGELDRELDGENACQTRFGFLAFMGLPNSGKSTLLNACVGQKIAGVSAKPQTTRNRIVGLIQGDKTQIAILDTPGLQRSESQGANASPSRLTRYMNQEAWGAANDADAICYLIDSTQGPTENDRSYLSDLILRYGQKVQIIVSKVDKLRKEERSDVTAEIKNLLESVVDRLSLARPEDSERIAVPKVTQLSAKLKEDVERFIERVSNLMPVGPHHYDVSAATDRSPSFICAELIREQVFRRLGQEIPYGTAVTVTEITRRPTGVRYVAATVYVPKFAHKGIIIGSHGSKLKEIGAGARPALESYFGDKVFLELFVKVQPGWTQNFALIEELQGAPSALV
jgi:GTP-binding protein Era